MVEHFARFDDVYFGARESAGPFTTHPIHIVLLSVMMAVRVGCGQRRQWFSVVFFVVLFFIEVPRANLDPPNNISKTVFISKMVLF